MNILLLLLEVIIVLKYWENVEVRGMVKLGVFVYIRNKVKIFIKIN